MMHYLDANVKADNDELSWMRTWMVGYRNRDPRIGGSFDGAQQRIRVLRWRIVALKMLISKP